MNIPVRHATAATKLSIVDCDIHPAFRKPSDLYPFMAARWREHMATFGEHLRQGLSGQLQWPRMMAAGLRVDAFPEEGPPGSDLELMRRQHLDANGVEYGMLMQLSKGGMEERNLEFAAALSHAINEWQLETFVKPEPRLRAGIVVPQEDAGFAVKEIEHRAADRSFAQIIISPRSSDPLGHRRYWPIFEAAERCNLPIGLHVQGFSGGHASTASGWPTYYMEEHYAATTGMQNTVTSLVFEGVFERFPKLKVISIEAGFGWVPSLAWRLDKHFEKLRSEVLHLKRKPSEYIRDHIWWTTQPMEDPERRDHLFQLIEWIGWDKLLFATDYPHWDFDEPSRVLPPGVSEANREAFYLGNAKKLYGIS